MSTWLTADWHFGHRNILTLGEGRPFTSIEEHDEALIARHNALVDPDDEVWVLGDVALGHIAGGLANCRRMNGRKILVCGNHDRPAQWQHKPEKRAHWTSRYLTEGDFAGVLLVESSTTIRLPTGQLVSASHYPYAGDSRDGPDRYPERRPVDEGGWLLHGHVHHSWQANGRQINVGVDVWDYEPVPAERIAELIASRSVAP